VKEGALCMVHSWHVWDKKFLYIFIYIYTVWFYIPSVRDCHVVRLVFDITLKLYFLKVVYV
jgi:hypothetical protein